MFVGSKSTKTTLLYVLTAIFLLISFYGFKKTESYWLFSLPLVIMVLYFYLVSLDKILLFITLFTPLAVNYYDSRLGASLSVPSEPLMIGIVLVFILNLIITGKYDRKLATHPVSYLVYLGLFWMFITTFTSSMPLVSIKYMISRIWFVVPFFFFAATVFKKKKNIHRFLLLYLLGISVVIIYTLIRHAQYGFDENAGHWVMTPFFNDHTAYGAALAFLLPVVGGYIFYPGISVMKRMVATLFFVFFIVALVLSYSRAAWLSIIVALFVLVMVLLRIHFKWLLLVLVVSASSVFIFQQQIFDRLEKNKQDSSTNFEQHVQSMSNISSDASNMERLNRWNSAIRMFKEKPWLGWGPGTYQFVYAPFQKAKDRTIISTNLGDKGNAHSEYLGPLSEEGIPGFIFVILLFGYIVYLGLKVYKNNEKETRVLALMITLGLITYIIHGFLNDFLNTDKLSVLFWGFIAILAALDVNSAFQNEGLVNN